MNNEAYHNRLANGFDQQLVPIEGSDSEVPVVLVLVGSDVPTQVQLDHPKWALGFHITRSGRRPPRCA